MGRFGPLVALDYCPACEMAPLIRRSGKLRCGSCKEEFELDPDSKRDLVPDVLASHDEVDEIFEKSGVHVGVRFPFPETIAPGDVLDLSFVPRGTTRLLLESSSFGSRRRSGRSACNTL